MCSDLKKANRELLEDFILTYQSQPCLWRIKSKYYHDKTKRDEAYNILLQKYRLIDGNASKEAVVKKINAFRTNYRREKKKVEECCHTGAGRDEIYEPSLWYYHLFDFLGDQDPQRSSLSNLNERKETTSVEKGVGPSTERRSVPPSHSPRRNFFKNYEVEDRSNEHSSLASTSNILRESTDEADILGETWVLEFKKLNPEQQIFAKKAINDILFEAQLGNLARHSVVINCEAEKPSFDTERFITEVQSRTVLWDMNVEEYSNCDLKKSAWEELVDIFVNEEETTAVDKNAFGRFLRRKWNKLRDSFYRESQRLTTLKSGLTASMKSQCAFYNQLSFLHKGIKIKDKDTMSNMDIEPVAEIPSGAEGATTTLPGPSWAHRHKRKKSEMESPEVAQRVDIIRKGIQSLDERDGCNDDDGDRLFLLSLINPLKNIPGDLRFSVRIQMMQLIEKASRRDCDSEIDRTLPFQAKISV